MQLWSPGDAVMGVVAGGAYAEAAVLHERQAMAVPERIGLPDAGALPEVFVTDHSGLPEHIVVDPPEGLLGDEGD